jgi:hypothetical protein
MVRDRNYFLWLLAVLRTQDTGNLNSLAGMFRSNFAIRDGERKLLAALCDRGQFKKKRGGQLTPIGKMSPKARRALRADQVRGCRMANFAYSTNSRPRMLVLSGFGWNSAIPKPPGVTLTIRARSANFAIRAGE